MKNPALWRKSLDGLRKKCKRSGFEHYCIYSNFLLFDKQITLPCICIRSTRRRKLANTPPLIIPAAENFISSIFIPISYLSRAHLFSLLFLLGQTNFSLYDVAFFPEIRLSFIDSANGAKWIANVFSNSYKFQFSMSSHKITFTAELDFHLAIFQVWNQASFRHWKSYKFPSFKIWKTTFFQFLNCYNY